MFGFRPLPPTFPAMPHHFVLPAFLVFINPCLGLWLYKKTGLLVLAGFF